MPSMFSRRRASSQPPQHTAPPSSSAAIAASAAFLNKSPSAASLSSAAAAAALRSHTTSPEPIGSIQTKRMVRRGSQTSIGSGSIMGAPSRNGGGRGMVRQNSNSSMTERSFRSPSPGGRGGAMSPAHDAPPVPSIPRSIPKGQRRSASLDVPTRITSPTSNGDRSNYADSPSQSKRNGLPKLPELEREDSNRSVNFSRPWSPAQGQAQAPPARPHSSVGWFTSPTVGSGPFRGDTPNRPQSSVGFSSPSSSNVQQKIQNAAEKPVYKKKKQPVVEGARLASGTMNTAPQGTAVAQSTTPVSTLADPNATTDGTTPTKKKKKAVAFPLDTNVSGDSSASPAKLSPSGTDTSRSPASPRAATTLHKQPSVVREDPEAEASAEVEPTPTKKYLSKSLSLKGTGRTVSTSEGPAQNYIAPGGAPRNRSVSLDIPRENGQRRSSDSSSPSRKVHAHFVEGSLIATPAYVKHQPPPRSVSPYKSALKHSPSSSIRTSSPNVNSANGSRVPNSDASDTTSLASQDGFKPAKKKKTARVSFDDGSTPISPVPETGRRDLSGSFSGDENFDELMKPRPALPSFGSVRGRKDRVQPDVPEKVTETVPSSISTTTSTLPDRSDMSSDQFIGAVIANHHASKSGNSSRDPLPPQVTGVEGTAYNSDSSYSIDDAGKHIQSSITHEKMPLSEKSIAEQPEPDVFEDSNEHNLAIPDISVQPATPGIEEEDQLPLNVPAEKSFSMPGGWDDTEETSVKQPPTNNEHEETYGTEPESSDDDSTLQPLPTGAERHSPLLQPIYESESDSDDSAAFSDAAEDPSEFEGGFASLDAILESPAGPRSPGLSVATPPDSPTTQLPALQQHTLQSAPLSSEPVVGEDGDWRQATAYWSSLSKTKKLEIERDSRPVEETPRRTETAPKPKKKRNVQNMPAVITDPSFFAPPEQLDSPVKSKAQREQPDSRGPALRKSMRDTAESAPINGEPHLRKSMRGSAEPAPATNETHMRKSMRAGAPAGGSMRSSMRGNDGGQRRAAPPSASVNGAPQPSASAGAIAGAQAQAMKKPVKPFVAPLPAYDSDSESSFKKKRRGSVSTVDSVGHYTMKRSMRSGSVDAGPQQRSMRSGSVDAGPQQRPTSPPTATRGSGRLSLRSLSPTGSFANRNRGENIRASLRGAPVNDGPTMRGKNSKAARDSKSPSRFSLSGFSKPKPSAAPPSSTKSRFSSRFAADSDDEDDAAPASRGGFRSRFADSDEEDSPAGPPRHVPADLAPVRGIPRRRDQDSDSTDLDDSEDERRKPRGRVGKKPDVPSQSDIDAAMAAARRNVAAMNGGREPGVAETRPETADSNQATAVQPEVPATPTRKKGFMGSLMGRRRSSSVVPGSPMSVQSQPTASRPPKLQRRNTPQNWPLSPPPKINGDDDRPATSDGTAAPPMKKTMRPDLGRRSLSGNDLKNFTDGGTYSERTGKKKKFSRLRRVFGLDD